MNSFSYLEVVSTFIKNGLAEDYLILKVLYFSFWYLVRLNLLQDLKRETESKESELHRCEVKMKSLDEIIVGLNKQITEAHSANESLQEKYDEVI